MTATTLPHPYPVPVGDNNGRNERRCLQWAILATLPGEWATQKDGLMTDERPSDQHSSHLWLSDLAPSRHLDQRRGGNKVVGLSLSHSRRNLQCHRQSEKVAQGPQREWKWEWIQWW